MANPQETTGLPDEVACCEPGALDRTARALAALPPVGSNFLGFQLISELGRGAFGRVYLARQGDLANRAVALKVSVDLTGESQMLAQLQHTHIVPIYSVHQTGALQAVCMPYFGPTTLADVLKDLQDRPVPPASGRALVSMLHDTILLPTHGGRTTAPTIRETDTPHVPARKLEGMSYVQGVLWIGMGLADGLAHAHDRGILHCDLKPANILLSDDGLPMLLDFNLSVDTKRCTPGATRLLGGTLPYMAPEHLEALRGGPGEVDVRADLYSLGVILYQLLTGRQPFPMPPGPLGESLPDMIEARRQPAPGLRCWNRAVSPALESIIRHCLEGDPDRRYQTAHELWHDLRCQLQDRPLRHAPEPSLRERARKWIRRHPRLTSPASVAALAAVLLAIGVVPMALQQMHRSQADADLSAAQEKFAKIREKLARTKAERAEQARSQLKEKSRLAQEAKEQLIRFEEHRTRAEGLAQREEALHIVQRLDDTPPRSQEQLDKAIAARRPQVAAACLAALDLYQVLNKPPWKDQPLVHALRRADQDELGSHVGDLLYLRTRVLLPAEGPSAYLSRLFATKPPPLPLWQPVLLPWDASEAILRAQAAHALRLNELAAACYPNGKTPWALSRDLYRLAWEQARLGQFWKAEALARKATRQDPGNFAAWLLRGVCNHNLGADSQAIGCYSTCTALAPSSSWPYYGRGLVFMHQGNYEEAHLDFFEMVKLAPELPEAYLLRAEALVGRGVLEGALPDADEAVLRKPSDARAYLVRADLHSKLGHHARAAEDRRRALLVKPTDAWGWTSRAIARAASPVAALADLDQALKLNPRLAPALKKKAEILAAQPLARWTEALQVLDRLVAYYPDSVDARVRRGLLLARLNQPEKARREADAVLRQRGNLPPRCFQAARIYALSAGGTPWARKRALQLLSEALQRGYGWDQLVTDRALACLGSEPEFQGLRATAVILRPYLRPGPADSFK